MLVCGSVSLNSLADRCGFVTFALETNVMRCLSIQHVSRILLLPTWPMDGRRIAIKAGYIVFPEDLR